MKNDAYFRKTHQTPAQSDKLEHTDYWRNLGDATAFVLATKAALLPGMAVYIAGSQYFDKALLTIAYNPEMGEPLGFFARPVSLHQESPAYQKEKTAAFNWTYDLATRQQKHRTTIDIEGSAEKHGGYFDIPLPKKNRLLEMR